MKLPPKGFREFATGRSLYAITRHFRCGDKVAKRWLGFYGLPLPACPHLERKSLTPAMIEQIKGMTQEEAALALGMQITTLRRCLREAGLSTRQPLRQPPGWYVSDAPGMTLEEIGIRAEAGHTVVKRWARETGVKYKPKPRVVSEVVEPLPVVRVMKIHGDAERAADFLRPRFPSFRCDETGKYKHGGFYWNFGGGPIDGKAVLERALRRGFDPNAWRKLADAA